jgi:UDP-2,3-diacylglucosamine hydrolase
MKALFISDVHLIDSYSPKTLAVVDFLEKKSSEFDHIFILGDLFDVWPGTTDYLIATFQPICEFFKKLIQKGCQIYYLEGNHDFRLGDYFTKEVGVKVYPNSFESRWGNKKVFLAHGDLGNPKEKGYRVLRSFLRSTWLHFLIKPIPKKWIFQLGQKTSQASRGYQKLTEEKTELIRQTYRNSARQLFEKGYDVVIMGHTHIPDDYSLNFGERECRYLNTGDWVSNFTYLEFDGVEFYTKRHSIAGL